MHQHIIHDVIHIVIVIPEFRRSKQELSNVLSALEIAIKCVDQLCHGNLLVLKDYFLNGSQAISHIRRAGHGNSDTGILQPAVSHILAGLNGSVKQNGFKGHWTVFGKHISVGITEHNGNGEEILHLLFIGIHHLLVGGKLAGIAGLHANELAGHSLVAIVQRQLQKQRHIDIAAGQVGRFPGNGRIVAAGDHIVAGILQLKPIVQKLLNAHLIAHKLQLAAQCLGNLNGFHNEGFRGLFGDTHNQII